MSESELVIEELVRFYDESPSLVMYKSNVLKTPQNELIREIAENNRDLNPIDVVLESLVNLLAERLSTENLTASKDTVCLDEPTQDLAVQRVRRLAEENASFLEEMHTKWLEKLQTFLSSLKEQGVQTVQEAVFQIGLRFRISTGSVLKAIASIGKM